MKNAASEPSKYQHSNASSRSSRISERSRLESRAKLLEQQSKMAIQKKERELELESKQWEMEFKAMQAETALANVRDQTSLKIQGMKLQIEEAEGSGHGSTISPSLMSLSIDEDKHSSVKNWLDQNSDVMDPQKQKSQ